MPILHHLKLASNRRPHRTTTWFVAVFATAFLMQFSGDQLPAEEVSEHTNRRSDSSDEFDFSDFSQSPSPKFQTTEPHELFDSQQWSVRSASHQMQHSGGIEAAEDGELVEPQSDLNVPLESVPPTDVPVVIPDASTDGRLYDPNRVESLKDLKKGRDRLNLERLAESPYENYRVDESMWSWIPGTGDDFGWFSMQSTTYEARGKRTSFGGMINIHWLGGPTTAPLNPRLYEIAL
ncbi:MAG: hypothetical protein ACK58L_02805 [Planctomycetota bacterium]